MLMLMTTMVLAQAQWPSPVAAHCGCRLGREGEAGRRGIERVRLRSLVGTPPVPVPPQRRVLWGPPPRATFALPAFCFEAFVCGRTCPVAAGVRLSDGLLRVGLLSGGVSQARCCGFPRLFGALTFYR